MKRIFTLMLAVVAICSAAAAKNLWTGSYYPVKSQSSECPKIAASEFAGLNVTTSPELVFTIDGDGDATARNFELWTDVDGGSKCILNKGYFVPGAQKIVVALTQELLENLQKYGFWPGGLGYTVTSIDLENTEAFDGVIWSGDQVLTWTAFDIAASKFSRVKAGNTLCIDFAAIINDWAGMDVMISGERAPFAKAQEQGLQNRTTPLKYNLSADDVAKLQTYGLGLAGGNVKVTKVYVEGEGITTGVEVPVVDARVNAAVYTMTGVKVAASLDEAGKLAPGIYVCGGKKFVVR